jgi:hypothetical protein
VNEDNQVPEAIENVTAAVLHLMTCLGAFADSAKAEQAKAKTPSPRLTPALPVAPAGPPPARPGIPGGGERLYVYVAGCAGCANLSRLHRFRLYKIGTTTDPGLDRRLAEIGHEQYGGAIHQGTGIEVEPGFEAWVALAIATSRTPLFPGSRFFPAPLPSTCHRQCQLEASIALCAQHYRSGPYISGRPPEFRNASQSM